MSVNLAAQTAAYEAGLKKASKQTRDFERQAKRSVLSVNNAFKGLGQIGGKIGLGGAFGGLVGGFTFANFAKESLQAHAANNAELKSSLDGLDKSLAGVKERFGAWLAETAQAGP